MPLQKPYRRLIRPFTRTRERYEWDYQGSSESYLFSPQYAPDRIEFVRAYRLIEDDLIQIFEYVQPANKNVSVYSHRLFQLLLRACTEFEANAKAILKANGYSKPSNFNMTDYYKLEPACRLSEYRVRTSVWSEHDRIFQPFKSWNGTVDYVPLSWYQGYNDSKHDRTANFPAASFENVLNAVAGVFVILFAQHYIHAFDPYRAVTMTQEDEEGFLAHSMPLFHIQPPRGWSESEKYDFDWKQLALHAEAFDRFPF